MKDKIFNIIIVLVLILSLPAGLLLSGASLPDFYQEAYYAELGEMYDRLYETEGKKIVVVGGSSVAFGLHGALLENTLAQMGYEYTVCPFGLYAAVGTSAMIDLSLNALGEGDIVILAIEPSSETMSTYFGATAFWKCTEQASQMLLQMRGDKLSALVGNYVPYLQERYAILNSGEYPEVEGVYARSSFNERCDMVYYRQGNTMAVGYDTANMINLSDITIPEAFVEQVNDYCAAAEDRGATVLMSFCPMNSSAIRVKDEETVNGFFTMLNETFDCPIISDPNEYILPSGWFYDNNFHLNTAGADLRTYLLAEDLLAYMGCYASLQYTPPAMPDAIPQMPEDNDADEADFLFTPITDEGNRIIAYNIAGLTEAGLAKANLSVPNVRNGVPIVGFNEDALAQAVNLVELRLPDTVEGLPDRLFANCPAMQRLILEHTERLCTITEHTFDGADQVRVLVPAAAYNLYRDGAGCAVNPWEEDLERIVTF